MLNTNPIVQIGPLFNVNLNISIGTGNQANLPVAIEDSDYYGGALRETEMQKVLHGANYRSIVVNGTKLPYSMEIPFFSSKPLNLSILDEWDCETGDDLVISADHHPLSDSLLGTALRNAYVKRRWDELDQWLAGRGDDSRNLIRIESIDTLNKKIRWARTSYATQAVTNLVMDMEVPGKQSLRWLTKPAQGLPDLADRRLANNLGISVLLIAECGKPILPLRDSEGVAIFPNEWGASLSTAAKHPSNVPNGSLSGLVLPAIRAMFKEEFHSESKLFESRLIPLALCREWFRGGKPQLFLAYESDISMAEAAKRLGKASHSDELQANSGIGNWLINKVSSNHTRRLNKFKGEKTKYSIEAMANFALYHAWRNT